MKDKNLILCKKGINEDYWGTISSGLIKTREEDDAINSVWSKLKEKD